MAPAVTQFTRTLGANSAAKLSVRLMRPALAAPYAAVPGEGRIPHSDEMLTIDPPASWSCITSLARWVTSSGEIRLRVMMALENRGEAVAADAGGEPPALFTTASSRP